MGEEDLVSGRNIEREGDDISLCNLTQPSSTSENPSVPSSHRVVFGSETEREAAEKQRNVEITSTAASMLWRNLSLGDIEYADSSSTDDEGVHDVADAEAALARSWRVEGEHIRGGGGSVGTDTSSSSASNSESVSSGEDWGFDREETKAEGNHSNRDGHDGDVVFEDEFKERGMDMIDTETSFVQRENLQLKSDSVPDQVLDHVPCSQNIQFDIVGAERLESISYTPDTIVDPSALDQHSNTSMTEPYESRSTSFTSLQSKSNEVDLSNRKVLAHHHCSIIPTIDSSQISIADEPPVPGINLMHENSRLSRKRENSDKGIPRNHSRDEKRRKSSGKHTSKRVKEGNSHRNRRKKKTKLVRTVNQYVLGTVLGEGSYGKVREAMDTHTLRRVAIKILRAPQLRKIKGGEESVQREIAIMKRLRHKNVVEMHEVLFDSRTETLYIALEHAGSGSLQRLIDLAKGIRMRMFKEYCRARRVDELNRLRESFARPSTTEFPPYVGQNVHDEDENLQDLESIDSLPRSKKVQSEEHESESMQSSPRDRQTSTGISGNFLNPRVAGIVYTDIDDDLSSASGVPSRAMTPEAAHFGWTYGLGGDFSRRLSDPRLVSVGGRLSSPLEVKSDNSLFVTGVPVAHSTNCGGTGEEIHQYGGSPHKYDSSDPAPVVENDSRSFQSVGFKEADRTDSMNSFDLGGPITVVSASQPLRFGPSLPQAQIESSNFIPSTATEGLIPSFESSIPPISVIMSEDDAAGNASHMPQSDNENTSVIFGALDENISRMYFRQLMEGLEYLHSQGVVHRDIKPGNLLLTPDGGLKISDFGVAELLELYKSSDICTRSLGSPAFQPPQIARGSATFSGYKLDIWACGVTLFLMVTGELPFNGENLFHLLDNIGKGVFSIPPFVSPPLCELIRGMLATEEEDRWSIEMIKKHPWYVAESNEELANLFEYDVIRLDFFDSSTSTNPFSNIYQASMACILSEVEVDLPEVGDSVALLANVARLVGNDSNEGISRENLERSSSSISDRNVRKNSSSQKSSGFSSMGKRERELSLSPNDISLEIGHLESRVEEGSLPRTGNSENVSSGEEFDLDEVPQVDSISKAASLRVDPVLRGISGVNRFGSNFSSLGASVSPASRGSGRSAMNLISVNSRSASPSSVAESGFDGDAGSDEFGSIYSSSIFGDHSIDGHELSDVDSSSLFSESRREVNEDSLSDDAAAGLFGVQGHVIQISAATLWRRGDGTSVSSSASRGSELDSLSASRRLADSTSLSTSSKNDVSGSQFVSVSEKKKSAAASNLFSLFQPLGSSPPESSSGHISLVQRQESISEKSAETDFKSQISQPYSIRRFSQSSVGRHDAQRRFEVDLNRIAAPREHINALAKLHDSLAAWRGPGQPPVAIGSAAADAHSFDARSNFKPIQKKTNGNVDDFINEDIEEPDVVFDGNSRIAPAQQLSKFPGGNAPFCLPNPDDLPVALPGTGSNSSAEIHAASAAGEEPAKKKKRSCIIL